MIDRRHFTRTLMLGVPALQWISPADTAARQRAEPPDFVELIDRISPAVVAIAGATQTLGSGFLVRSNVAVTAAHVVQAAGSPIFVLSSAGRQPARIIARDEPRDIALIEISDSRPSVTLPLAESASRVGEWVIVLGNPFGSGVVATVGIVSAAPGAITATAVLAEKIQINAAVNPGNSGGPICNMRGEVVAVASSLVPGGQGIAFATPAGAIRRLLASPGR